LPEPPAWLSARIEAQWVAQKGTDFQCWMDIAADDAKLSSLAEGAPEMTFTAPRTTKSEIRGYLEELTRDWEMVFHEINDFIAQGDRVVVLGEVEWCNKATGKSAETRKVDVWLFRD
jgi:ketosteroid isomerase-like protein